MALVKTAPSAPPAKRQLEEFVDRFFRHPFATVDLVPFTTPDDGFSPALDLVESEKEYLLRLEVPGIPRENLDVNLVGQTLTVSGHREKAERKENEMLLWEEREAGRFTRTIKLPQGVDSKKIDALCQDGILTVHLPKAEPEVKNRIVIRS